MGFDRPRMGSSPQKLAKPGENSRCEASGRAGFGASEDSLDRVLAALQGDWPLRSFDPHFRERHRSRGMLSPKRFDLRIVNEAFGLNREDQVLLTPWVLPNLC